MEDLINEMNTDRLGSSTDQTYIYNNGQIEAWILSALLVAAVEHREGCAKHIGAQLAAETIRIARQIGGIAAHDIVGCFALLSLATWK